MSTPGTFKCDVITPERVLLSCEARSAVISAHDGEMGILYNHAPLMCMLGIGLLRVDATDGQHTLFIDGGFAQVVDNQMTVLTQQAKSAAELKKDAVRQAMAEAKQLPITDDASYEARQKAIERAEAQTKLVG